MVALWQNRSVAYWQGELRRVLEADAAQAEPSLRTLGGLARASVIADLRVSTEALNYVEGTLSQLSGSQASEARSLLRQAAGLDGNRVPSAQMEERCRGRGLAAARAQAAGAPPGLVVVPFLDAMGDAYAAADVVVARLSAGQRRRTALACLVARRAELWLLDEPHAGLDASARDELDHTLRQAAASGATIVVASHELERAGSLATRTVDVIAGRVHEATL